MVLMASAQRIDMSTKTPIELSALKIDKPEWFKNQSFLDWLNSSNVATWHVHGEEPTEYSDIFMVLDDIRTRTGSDDDMPMWGELCEICERHGFVSGIVWIRNL